VIFEPFPELHFDRASTGQRPCVLCMTPVASEAVRRKFPIKAKQVAERPPPYRRLNSSLSTVMLQIIVLRPGTDWSGDD
jgi:hypothetical protein